MSLLERLRACVTDEREIEPLISAAAGGSSKSGPSNSVEYVSYEDGHQQLFARLRFKEGRVTVLEPGPLLSSTEAQNAFVTLAQEQAAHNHGTIVSTRVLFSQRKLMGSYSWKDRISISPCPIQAPIGCGLDWASNIARGQMDDQHQGPPFPFLLQVRSQRSPNGLLQAHRVLRDLDVYQYLLVLLLNGGVSHSSSASERVWVSLKREENIEYHLLYPGFGTGGNEKENEFSKGDSEPAPIYSGPDYYNHLWSRDAELVISDRLSEDLTTFETLPHQLKYMFIRAAYWYSLAMQHKNETSISIVAFSTAIECLLPKINSKSCQSCSKPTGPGPTQLFKSHIKRYGTVPAGLENSRNKIYSIRSMLVHGTRADHIDSGYFSSSRTSFSDLVLLELVSRRSLIGWLRDPARGTWHLNADHGSS